MTLAASFATRGLGSSQVRTAGARELQLAARISAIERERVTQGVKKALKRLLLGSASLTQQFPIGVRDRQSEVSVWLHGLGAPLDVTHNNVVAAARPFTIGIGIDGNADPATMRQARLSLLFREQGGGSRLLGKISLRLKEAIPVGDEQLCLFETRDCKNYCLPGARLRMYYLQHAYQRWRRRRHNPSKIQMVGREASCLLVFYICPRPVVLVSAMNGDVGNIFPMDLIGPVGTRYFSLALHTTSMAVPLLERSRRVALSSIPLERMPVAYELGMNHNNPCVDWDALPFVTTRSAAFGFPVPCFSLRVRELQIDEVRTLGSHKVFLAHTVEDQRWADGLEVFLIHGFYQAWRCRARPRADT